jgi:ZIP family zinc transporter
MIQSFLESLSPVQQAALGGLGTWMLTLLGALPVLFIRRVNRSLMDGMMGGAAGIMVAAACWSLLVPALEAGGVWRSLTGLGFGAVAIWGLDRVIPHLHPEFPDEAATEGPSVAWTPSTTFPKVWPWGSDSAGEIWVVRWCSPSASEFRTSPKVSPSRSRCDATA